jgi:hypothetical protein
MRLTRFVVAVVAATLVPHTATADSTQKPLGLKYFVGKDVVVVNVTTTVTTTRKIETLLGEARKRCLQRHGMVKPAAPTATDGQPAPPVFDFVDRELCVTSTATTTRDGSVGLQLVPDMELSVDVSTDSPSLVDEQSSVQLTDGLLLKSINLSSTGRAGDLLVSIAKFAGTVLGGASIGIHADQPPAPPLAPSDCDPFQKPFKDLPDTVRLWLWQQPARCADWRAIAALQDKRDARATERAELQAEIRSATKSEMKDLLEKTDALEKETSRLDKEIKTRRDTFDVLLATFVGDLRLGNAADTKHYDQVLELTDLPNAQGLSDRLPEDQVDPTKLRFSPDATLLWKAARTIVTLDGTMPTDSVKVPENPQSTKVVQIAFRQGVPAHLRVFISDQRPDPGESSNIPSRLRSVSDRWLTVIHPKGPVGVVRFSKSVWAKRDFVMTFDEKGRPAKLDRSSGSNAAAIAAAIASAATTARDEYASTLSKAVQIESDRRTLRLGDLTTRLEELKKSKDVLDAQVSLDAAGTNRDVVLRQQQATADLAALQAEIALQSAQDSSEQKRQINELTLEIEQIKRQIDLLQAQKQLDALKKNPGD